MAQRTCSIDECTSPVRSRGWCGKHYQRWGRTGDASAPAIPRYPTFEASFAANVPERPDENGCRLWGGGAGSKGYGLIWAKRKYVSAHRYSWEKVHGPIPEGMFVDHRFHCNKRCVEVSHLRLATVSQNNMNRSGAASHNATGVRGVSKSRNKFSARASKAGVTYNAGTFPTIEEAAEAVRKLRAELFGEFAGRG